MTYDYDNDIDMDYGQAGTLVVQFIAIAIQTAAAKIPAINCNPIALPLPA